VVKVRCFFGRGALPNPDMLIHSPPSMTPHYASYSGSGSGSG
jgi:hypothetical protein